MPPSPQRFGGIVGALSQTHRQPRKEEPMPTHTNSPQTIPDGATAAQRATVAQLSTRNGEPATMAPAFLDRRTPPAIEGWIGPIFYHAEPEGAAHS